MATYDAFLPLLYPLVPNAPEPSAIIALRNACIEFCNGSLFLREPLDPIASVKNIGQYEIDTPTGTGLAHIVNLYFDGGILVRRTASEIASSYSRDWQLLSGTPRMYTMFNTNEVTLVPMPDKSITGAITGIIALTPTRASTTIDEQMFEQYAEEIVHGAAARLYAIPNQPFTDQKASLYYSKLFGADIANARGHVTSGLVRAPMIVRLGRI